MYTHLVYTQGLALSTMVAFHKVTLVAVKKSICLDGESMGIIKKTF